MELQNIIDQTIASLAPQLQGHTDASQLLRRLFDGLSKRVLEDASTDHITASDALIEVIDAESGRLYRRYLELNYDENDNGIRLTGETLAGDPTHIVFLSETALQKMHQLRGGGPEVPRCATQ
jgi:hypothetical protein